jgi:hypothetical protein
MTIRDGQLANEENLNAAFVSRSEQQNIENKALIDSSVEIVNVDDPTRKFKFERIGTSGTAVTLKSSATSNRTITFPNATTSLVGTTDTATLTNKTISAASNSIITAATGNLVSTELNSALGELQGDIDGINAALNSKEPTIAASTIAKWWRGDKTWQDISALPFMPIQADLSGGIDLNDYISSGYYHQNSNSSAASGSNYPDALAGMLHVISDGSMTYQTYHTYLNGGYYFRAKYNSTWSAWKAVISDADAGAFVVGPSSVSNEQIVRFDSTTGKLVKGGTGTITAAGAVAGLTGLVSSGTVTFSGAVNHTTNTTNTQTGSSVNITGATSTTIRLTSGSLSSIGGYNLTTSGRRTVFINSTGSPITVIDEDASVTAANRFRAGGKNFSLPDGAAFETEYNATTARHHVIGGPGGGGGSGQGGINYISNPDFETVATGWNNYTDSTTSEEPIDGTGGANYLDIVRVTTAPLRGDGSGEFGKTGNRRGSGVSTDFAIDPADKAKIINISFDYSTDGGYSDGDVRVFVFDKTNSKLIHLVDRDLAANSTNGTYRGFFQAASDSLDYRLVLHWASSSTVVASIKLDNVKVAPAAPRTTGQIVVQQSSYMNNASTFTATSTVTGALTSQAGSSSLYSYNSGTGVYTALRKLNLSISHSAGATSASPGQLGITVNGTISNYSGTNASGAGWSTSASWNGIVDAGSTWSTTVTTGSLNGHRCSVSATYVSDNVVLSEDAGTREVSFRGAENSSQVITANTTNIPFITAADSTSSWNGSVFTVPETGFYLFEGSVYFSTSVTGATLLQVDSANKIIGVATSSRTHPFSGLTYAVKGQSLSIRHNAGGTLTSGAPVNHHLVITKLASPQTIAATETVAVRATSATGLSVANGTEVPMTFTTKEYDTHNSFNMANGTFTAPVSGKYHFSGHAVYASLAWGAGTTSDIRLFKNGALSAANRELVYAAITNNVPAKISTTLDLAKGDTVQVNLRHSRGSASALLNLTEFNYISIERVGN